LVEEPVEVLLVAASLGNRRQPLCSRDPFLTPAVSISVDDSIGSRQHLSDVPSSVVRTPQRALKFEIELLVIEKRRAICRSSLDLW